MAIYMKYGDIDGQVTTEGFLKWIELESFQWGVQRATKPPQGGIMRESSNPTISEIRITKFFDKASSKIIQHAMAGTFDPRANIAWTTTTKNKVETFLAVELDECAITSFEINSGRDNSPMENLSLNFRRIVFRTTLLNNKGQQEVSGTVGYDLFTMKTM